MNEYTQYLDVFTSTISMQVFLSCHKPVFCTSTAILTIIEGCETAFNDFQY